MTNPKISTALSAEPGRAHAQMHREHRGWGEEGALWREEVAVWQRELTAALAELPKLKAALEDLQRDTQVHAAGIHLRHEQLAHHEHVLAQFEQGGSGEELPELAKAHQQEADTHVQQRVAHHRLKQRLEELLAALRSTQANVKARR